MKWRGGWSAIVAVTLLAVSGACAGPPHEEVDNGVVASSGTGVHGRTDLAADMDGGIEAETMAGDIAAAIWAGYGRMYVQSDAPHPAIDAPSNVRVSPRPSLSTGARQVDKGVEQWRGLVSAYFPAYEVDNVLRVIGCESGGRSDAYNNGNYGLLQINAVHAAKVHGPLTMLYNPDENVRVAYVIWADQGWSPWACKP